MFAGLRESVLAMPQGQLAGSKAGMTECDRGSAEQGLGESRHNNADGRG